MIESKMPFEKTLKRNFAFSVLLCIFKKSFVIDIANLINSQNRNKFEGVCFQMNLLHCYFCNFY